MNKKINRIEVRQTAQKAAIRDEQNRRIQFAATHPTQETLGISEHNTLWTGTGKSRGKPFRIWFQ